MVAVGRGIAITSGTVTSAAAIMVVVCAVFASLRIVIIRELARYGGYADAVTRVGSCLPRL